MTLTTLAELHTHYQNQKHVVHQRLKEFTAVRADKEAVFYELCFCLLTPGSNGKRCARAVEELRKLNIHLVQKLAVQEILRKYTRFYKHKHAYLQSMVQLYLQIWTMLDSVNDPAVFREWLVQSVPGLGYKEASHFLRNIGFRGLCILDRHILKNLVALNVIPETPKTLTRRRYLDIEQKLLAFSEKVGINADELDLVFWSAETGEVFK